MQKDVVLRMLPSEASSDDLIKDNIANNIGVSSSAITGYYITRRSLDARGRQQYMLINLKVFIDEPFINRPVQHIALPDVSHAKHTVIVAGAGPAGLFASLKLMEAGIKPIIIERGKDVRSRRRDLAMLNKEGILNPESNYCFGEGGAGTYSDGKLYTRSTKRGDVSRILNILVQFGADSQILYEAHPHIGTNKLPQIITAVREGIVNAGGEFHFESKLTDIFLADNKVSGIEINGSTRIESSGLILATGHSARDIYLLLKNRSILIESKPFALGVRIEHPQELIDSIQYHCTSRSAYLPPASYSLVQQVDGRGVFSFCMCPGGIIAPASTDLGELVVNGWSPSKRNNPFANSGMVVSIEKQDLMEYEREGELAGMFFQKSVEQKAFNAGGGQYVAPAQRMIDFANGKLSASIPPTSYLPGVQSSMLDEVLPAFVNRALQQALREFGKKMRGYFTNEAVIVATESRTSSPVRIPRNKETLEHPQVAGLYPCAEGAGYAGGIVSAAIDGERVAESIAKRFQLARK